MRPDERSSPPSLAHLAGTDSMGRDVFSRLMVGARFTLAVALVTVACSSAVGVALGMASGFAGGSADEALMRLMDALNSFPGMLVALVVVCALDFTKYAIAVALCVMFIPSYARIARMETIRIKDSPFVKNARAFGASNFRLLYSRIFPNVFPMLLPSIVVGFSNAILAESGMSYLGLGIQPPAPSWGRMLSESQNVIFSSPWCALSAGLSIVCAVSGFNCLGEGLRKKYARHL